MLPLPSALSHVYHSMHAFLFLTCWCQARAKPSSNHGGTGGRRHQRRPRNAIGVGARKPLQTSSNHGGTGGTDLVDKWSTPFAYTNVGAPRCLASRSLYGKPLATQTQSFALQSICHGAVSSRGLYGLAVAPLAGTFGRVGTKSLILRALRPSPALNPAETKTTNRTSITYSEQYDDKDGLSSGTAADHRPEISWAPLQN